MRRLFVVFTSARLARYSTESTCEIACALACRAFRRRGHSEVCAAMKQVTEIESSEAGEPFAPDFLTIKEAADLVRIGRARPIGTVPGNNTERPARSVPADNTGGRSSATY